MLYAKLFVSDEPWSFYIMRYFEDRDGGEQLVMRVERGNDEDAFSEWRLPELFCAKSYGFSEMELGHIKNFLNNNQMMIWRLWEREAKQKIA